MLWPGMRLGLATLARRAARRSETSRFDMTLTSVPVASHVLVRKCSPAGESVRWLSSDMLLRRHNALCVTPITAASPAYAFSDFTGGRGCGVAAGLAVKVRGDLDKHSWRLAAVNVGVNQGLRRVAPQLQPQVGS